MKSTASSHVYEQVFLREPVVSNRKFMAIRGKRNFETYIFIILSIATCNMVRAATA